MSGAAQQYSTAMCCESGSWTFHVKLVVAMLYLTCCVLPAGMSTRARAPFWLSCTLTAFSSGRASWASGRTMA